MRRSIGSMGITGREAIASLARKQGTNPDAVLKKEMAAHRAFSRRGALYRADIMGTGGSGTRH